jgi:hypothetical protein
MAYATIPYLPPLPVVDMEDAEHLFFHQHAGNDGYENEAVFTGTAPVFPVFSFTAVAGALYTVTSASYHDPDHLVLYDDRGYAIAQDDGLGPYGEDGLSFIAPYSGTYYVDASWVPAAGDARVDLDILEDLDTAPVAVGNGTPGDDAITGTAAGDALYGNGGDDLLIGKGGDDLLDGGSGIDTASYAGYLDEYDVAVSGHRIFVHDAVGLDGHDTLINVERVEFADVSLAFDVDGPAGEAYRLYQAAFDRVPDEDGLGYWIAQMDAGASVRNVAGAFAASAEFAAIYGSRPSNATVLTGIYEHVLHRAPDAAGYAYWLDILNSHRDSVAGVLASFSESQENYAQLVGTMEKGMAYQAWA